MALSDAQILEILNTGGTRGMYKVELTNFKNSSKKIMEVNLAEGLFSGKTAATVKQGFENAKSSAVRDDESFKQLVVKRITEKNGNEVVSDKVYLINQALLSGSAATAE